MHHKKKLTNSDWKHALDKFQKHLSSWKRKLLSVGGRLMLLYSILSSVPLIMLSFFEVPKEVLKKLRLLCLDFFWQNEGHKKKYHLTKWDVLCTPKD
jgi:isopenicillin N synthase-like dioxygenase